mmetsp:Transcript_130107/g.277970  ORF Transcript_130107/g.277970 Transcript_130107/m.277970 type:complete len:398 (-) Transcript_130107:228-1421(-)
MPSLEREEDTGGLLLATATAAADRHEAPTEGPDSCWGLRTGDEAGPRPPSERHQDTSFGFCTSFSRAEAVEEKRRRRGSPPAAARCPTSRDTDALGASPTPVVGSGELAPRRTEAASSSLQLRSCSSRASARCLSLVMLFRPFSWRASSSSVRSRSRSSYSWRMCSLASRWACVERFAFSSSSCKALKSLESCCFASLSAWSCLSKLSRCCRSRCVSASSAMDLRRSTSDCLVHSCSFSSSWALAARSRAFSSNSDDASGSTAGVPGMTTSACWRPSKFRRCGDATTRLCLKGLRTPVSSAELAVTRASSAWQASGGAASDVMVPASVGAAKDAIEQKALGFSAAPTACATGPTLEKELSCCDSSGIGRTQEPGNQPVRSSPSLWPPHQPVSSCSST